MEVNNSFPTNYLIENDHKSVAFVMNSLSTWIICWETIVNLHNFYSLNKFVEILSDGLGWSCGTLRRAYFLASQSVKTQQHSNSTEYKDKIITSLLKPIICVN